MEDALAKLIIQAQSVLNGRSPGGGNTGQQISVRVNGRSPIRATCGGTIPPGECTVFQTQRGWVALSSLSPHAIAAREIQSRQSRQRDRVDAVGNIKTLLTRVNGSGLTEIYVGGDREVPTLVHTSLAVNSIQSIGLTNSGASQNGWIVSVHESGSIDNNAFIKYRSISPQATYIWSEFTETTPETGEIYLGGLQLANQIIERSGFITTGDGGRIGNEIYYQSVGLYKGQVFTLIELENFEPIIYEQPFPGVAIKTDQYFAPISDWTSFRVARLYTDDEQYRLDAENLSANQARFRLLNQNLDSTIFDFAGTQHPIGSAVNSGLGFLGFVGGVSFWTPKMYTIKSLGTSNNGTAIATVAPYLFSFGNQAVLAEQTLQVPYFAPSGYTLIQALYFPR